MIEIRMLGALEILIEGVPHAFAAPPRTLPLFGYLMLARGRPVPRDDLAFVLWPDAMEEDARADLRRHLYYLGKALPPAGDRPWFHGDKKFITWQGDGRAEFDVTRFETLMKDENALDRAMALYRGPLLAGVDEPWVEPERARIETLALDALRRSIDATLESDPARAVVAARQMLRIDPWREDALRAALEARTRTGDRAGALAEYREFERNLRKELDVAPMPETRALHDRIAAGEIEQTHAHPLARGNALAAATAIATASAMAAGATVSALPLVSIATEIPHAPSRGNVPLSTAPLLGRDAIVAEVEALLAQKKLVTLTGLGGAGKSAIAREIARRSIDRYAAGVWIVDFTNVGKEPNAVADLIARTIGRVPVSGAATNASVCESIGQDEMLLVFDNCENAIEPVAYAMLVISDYTGARILAASRERANLTYENVIPIEALEADAAIELFIERAHRSLPTFAPDDEALPQIAKIVAKLEGLPLAIELAAARVATLGVAGVGALLDDRMHLLVGGDRTLPSRQRTMRASIEWSFQALDEHEQRAFEGLASLEGWTPRGVIPFLKILDVGDDPDGVLDSLFAKSLVSVEERNGVVRHRMLETLRAFANERVSSDPKTRTTIEVAHQLFASDFARTIRERRDALADDEWFALAHSEWSNLRAALPLFARGFEREGDAGRSLLAAATSIADVGDAWPYLAGASERAFARDVLARLERAGGEAGADENLLAAVAVVAAACAPPGDDARLAAAHALALARKKPDRAILAAALGVYVEALLAAGRSDEARVAADEAVWSLLTVGPSKEAALALVRQGIAQARSGDAATAATTLERGIAVSRDAGAAVAEARGSRALAALAFASGDPARAGTLALEAKVIFQRLWLPHTAARADADLAAFATAEGNFEHARRHATAAFDGGRHAADEALERLAVERMAVILGLEGAFTRAATLLGYVDAKRWDLGATLDSIDRPGYDRLIAALTAALPQEQIISLGSEGAKLQPAVAGYLAFKPA